MLNLAVFLTGLLLLTFGLWLVAPWLSCVVTGALLIALTLTYAWLTMK